MTKTFHYHFHIYQITKICGVTKDNKHVTYQQINY